MKSKLLAFFIGAVCVLLALEFGMRAVARARKLAHAPSNVNSLGLPNTGPSPGKNRDAAQSAPIKIVVLGESTTAPWYIGDKDIAWPAVIEKRLNAEAHLANRSGREVKVINLARSGVSSTLLVDHLTETLETMTPDIVITMMGINDSVSLSNDRGFIYQNSFLARFLYWSYVSVRCPNCYRITNEFINDDPVANEALTIDRFTKEIEKRGIRNTLELSNADQGYLTFKKEVAPALSRPHADRDSEIDIVWATWLYVLSETPEMQRPEKKEIRRAVLNLSEKYFASVRPVVVKRKGSIKQNCFVLNRLEKWDQCLGLIKEGLRAGVKLTPDFFALALTADADKDPELRETIESLGYSVHKNRSAIVATRASYQNVLALQKRHGFQWLVMQYPRGSVDGLRLLLDTKADTKTGGDTEANEELKGFADIYNYDLAGAKSVADAPADQPAAQTAGRKVQDGVFLVSNENFRTVVTKENEAEYFFDLFGRSSGADFGHTTEKGHALIADNVLKALGQTPEFK